MTSNRDAVKASLFYYMENTFYNSAKWIKLRESILRRDHYMCQYYKRFGRMVEATIVHHVFPRSEFPEYQYEPWNLLSVSRKAHNIMHDRDSDRLTEKGREVLFRIARKNNIKIPEQYRQKIKKHSASKLRRVSFGYMEY